MASNRSTVKATLNGEVNDMLLRKRSVGAGIKYHIKFGKSIAIDKTKALSSNPGL